MIIYNVTVNIDEQACDEWIEWMKSEHIPEVLATGHFKGSTFSKILAEEAGGFAYSIQYLAKSREDYETYVANHAPLLQQKHASKFGTKSVAFRTLLDVIHQSEANG